MPKKPSKKPPNTIRKELLQIVEWYFQEVYGRWEGPGTLPFYCDPGRVGRFAVRPDHLRSGRESSLFRLFVALSMFQARRDVVIMAQQRAMPREGVLTLTSPARISRSVKLAVD